MILYGSTCNGLFSIGRAGCKTGMDSIQKGYFQTGISHGLNLIFQNGLHHEKAPLYSQDLVFSH